MKKYFQPKHLPIPIGVTVLVLGLVAGIFAINRVQNFSTRASPEDNPLQVKITNIGQSSFTVSWITTEEISGSLTSGEDKERGEINKDIRDKDRSSFVKSKVHFVTAENLKPQTKYYFKIVSNGKTYDNSGKPYEITTASVATPEDNDISQGRILDSSGSPLANALVYLSLANTVEQAAITDQNGHWMIPLATSRTINLQNISNYDRSAQIIEITAKTGTNTATATLTTANDNPTSDITMGENHNFMEEKSISQTSTSETEINQSNFQAPTSVPFSQTENLTILSPSEDEKVNSVVPEFIGKGPKGEELTIEVESDQKITASTKIDNQGTWKWSPNKSLTPGEHNVTVSYVDSSGVLQKISRTFVVLAAGESDLPSFTSTPSGEINNPTAVPSPTGVPTTPSKAAQSSPTSIPMVTEDLTVSPTATQLPDSGVDSPSIIFLGAGILTIMVSLALVFF
jgi:hypothetical protein